MRRRCWAPKPRHFRPLWCAPTHTGTSSALSHENADDSDEVPPNADRRRRTRLLQLRARATSDITRAHDATRRGNRDRDYDSDRDCDRRGQPHVVRRIAVATSNRRTPNADKERHDSAKTRTSGVISRTRGLRHVTCAHVGWSWRSSVRHRDDAAPRDVDSDCLYAAVLLCRTVCLSRKVQGFQYSTAPNCSLRVRARKWGLVGSSPRARTPSL